MSGVGRVVLASSGAVYGDLARQPLKETSTPNPRSPYAVSKLAAEYYVHTIGGLWGIETVSLRIFTAYGPGQHLPASHPPVVPHYLKQALRSGTLVLSWDFGDALTVVAKILVFLAFVPLAWMTALLILSLFGMPAMVAHVAERRYPALARRQGGHVAGSVWNGVVALAGLAALCVITLPAWLVPPLWPLIPVAIMGWVNQRVLRYDALAEHASVEEMLRVFAADVLECPKCRSPMRILAQIHPPDTTRAILECLGLSARPPPVAPARHEPEEVLLPGWAPEREDEGP